MSALVFKSDLFEQFTVYSVQTFEGVVVLRWLVSESVRASLIMQIFAICWVCSEDRTLVQKIHRNSTAINFWHYFWCRVAGNYVLAWQMA